ncbi:hypothetical protein MNBD_CPR01-196 [hydrothermal vent metagenome]|uniref:POTRA domain-containing protein n=1 Tax=hydrothermal vent metagenome TaxID=652676 RepID=A0A3B0UZ57_9ZZZZ
MPNKRNVVLNSRSLRSRAKNVRLSERRRVARLKRSGVFGILFVFLIVLFFIGIRQPAVRISRIVITSGMGINKTKLRPIVMQALSGEYAYIVPRDSIFFFSVSSIRNAILSARPRVATVSVSRVGYNSISISLEPRTPLARWCGGVSTSTPTNNLLHEVTAVSNGRCYLFDGTGFLYGKIKSYLASSTLFVATDTPITPYLIYAPLVGAVNITATGTDFIGDTVSHSSELPHVFDFTRKIHSFGANVFAIVLRGDEVDLFLKNDTRITYVLGDESSAFSLLFAVKDKISFRDNSLLYVDLRFPGKVYFKKRDLMMRKMVGNTNFQNF